MISDYLAVISLNSICGSYGRDPDKAKSKAVATAARICKQDFSHLFEIEGDMPVNVIDVDGYDDVWWDSSGVWCGNSFGGIGMSRGN